jgi:hypothetical protein
MKMIHSLGYLDGQGVIEVFPRHHATTSPITSYHHVTPIVAFHTLACRTPLRLFRVRLTISRTINSAPVGPILHDEKEDRLNS